MNIESLDETAFNLLSESSKFGDVFIITNAALGWVEYSSKIFLQRTHKFLIENDIKIISARQGYENIYPNDSRKWKIGAFLEIPKYFEKDVSVD